ncbi:MAG: hypothetical protein D6689_21435 [Deltaproteobacteria bacterium]|nr:MAG: hypothetical protein D6689_21435 [Deltaproteobacteria bacterium]
MSHSRLAWAAAACAAAVIAAAPARADQTPSSTIAQIMVLERSDSRYREFHGAVWLQVDKATYNYRWGGRHCNGADLSDASLRMLFDAFRERYVVSLDYTIVRTKAHTARCITGFTVTR